MGGGGRERAVRSRLLLMLRGTRWLAEFQRRVGKDGGSGKSGGGGGGVEALRCGGRRVSCSHLEFVHSETLSHSDVNEQTRTSFVLIELVSSVYVAA